jgi:hypothetical protein
MLAARLADAVRRRLMRGNKVVDVKTGLLVGNTHGPSPWV